MNRHAWRWLFAVVLTSAPAFAAPPSFSVPMTADEYLSSLEVTDGEISLFLCNKGARGPCRWLAAGPAGVRLTRPIDFDVNAEWPLRSPFRMLGGRVCPPEQACIYDYRLYSVHGGSAKQEWSAAAAIGDPGEGVVAVDQSGRWWAIAQVMAPKKIRFRFGRVAGETTASVDIETGQRDAEIEQLLFMSSPNPTEPPPVAALWGGAVGIVDTSTGRYRGSLYAPSGPVNYARWDEKANRLWVTTSAGSYGYEIQELLSEPSLNGRKANAAFAVEKGIVSLNPERLDIAPNGDLIVSERGQSGSRYVRMPLLSASTSNHRSPGVPGKTSAVLFTGSLNRQAFDSKNGLWVGAVERPGFLDFFVVEPR